MANRSNDPETARKKALESALEHIKRRFGEGSIMQLGSGARLEIDKISTGSLGLDRALGIGGLPRGRITEIYGPESSGKTTLALQVIANAQKNHGVAAFIDAEHALDPGYARRLGINLDHLLISQPDYGEQALEIAESLISSGGVDIVVIDSVAALIPKAELDGEIGDTHVGLQARLMSQSMRKLAAVIARTNCCAVFINQIREKIGVMFGSPETTPGGRALKYYSSVRIDIRRIGQVKVGTEVVASRTRAKVVKNKVAAPFRQAEFDIVYNKGICWVGEVIDLGVEQGLVQKKGAWFSAGDTRLGQGRENSIAFLEEHNEVRVDLENELISRLWPQPEPAPPAEQPEAAAAGTGGNGKGKGAGKPSR